MKAEFSYYNCMGFLKKAGAVQVSEEAVEEFRKIVEEIAVDIAKRAVLFAEDADRLKVAVEHVRNANKDFLSGSARVLC
ncbi:MAG: histone [Nitrososphaerales archaeon]